MYCQACNCDIATRHECLSTIKAGTNKQITARCSKLDMAVFENLAKSAVVSSHHARSFLAPFLFRIYLRSEASRLKNPCHVLRFSVTIRHVTFEWHAGYRWQVPHNVYMWSCSRFHICHAYVWICVLYSERPWQLVDTVYWMCPCFLFGPMSVEFRLLSLNFQVTFLTFQTVVNSGRRAR